MEEIRREIRDLVQYLEAKEQPRSYIDIVDTEVISVTGEQPLMPLSNEMYKRQVERFIREHKNHVTISKLNINQPITEAEIEELQRILFDGGERGSIDQFREVYGDQPLGVFIRSIIGLDIQAAQQLFSDFLQSGDLTADQMKFIDSIIKHLTRNGTIDKSLLFKPPFTNTNDKGLLGVFDDAQVTKIVALLDGINENAEVG